MFIEKSSDLSKYEANPKAFFELLQSTSDQSDISDGDDWSVCEGDSESEPWNWNFQ